MNKRLKKKYRIGPFAKRGFRVYGKVDASKKNFEVLFYDLICQAESNGISVGGGYGKSNDGGITSTFEFVVTFKDFKTSTENFELVRAIFGKVTDKFRIDFVAVGG